MGFENPARNPQEANLQRQEKLPNIDVHVKSTASEDHPETNEDAMFFRKDRQMFGVLDGMGGMAAGEVASAVARDYLAQALQNAPEGHSLPEVQELLTNILKDASEQVLEHSKKNKEWSGMGTTASIVKIFEDSQGGRKAVIGNVGDSRVYILRADGKLEQVTIDDGIIREQMKKGIINEQEARRLQGRFNNCDDPVKLTPQERSLFDNRNVISQALGHRGVEPRIFTVDVRDGDKVITTSDGIHDNLTDQEIQEIIAAAENGNEAAQNLVNASLERSRDRDHLRHKQDDMSAIVVGFGQWQKQSQSSERNTKQQEQIRPPLRIEKPGEVQLRVGNTVRIRRSDGRIDEGWIINRFNMNTGDAILRKRENGKLVEKEVPQNEIRDLNRPEQTVAIPGAKDFPELFRALDAAGGLQGSEKFYSVQELKNDINKVHMGELEIDKITRTGGLRQRVADLLKLEETHQRIEGIGTEKQKIFQNLERSIAGYKQRPAQAPFTGQDAAFAFKDFVDKVDSLVQSSLSREEAKRLSTIINSFPRSTIYPQDELRLRPLRDTIETMAKQ